MRLAALAAAAIFVAAAYALPAQAEEPQSPEGCPLGADLARLEETQRTAPGGTEELTARKRLLELLFTCARDEASRAAGEVKATEPADDEMKTAAERFGERFSQAEEYLELQRRRIPDLGIQGTKDAARELKEWRGVTYLPLAAQAGQYRAWHDHQALFRAAEDRLRGIQRMLRVLALLDREAVRNAFSAAERDTRTALTLNDEARKAIARLAAPADAGALTRDSLRALATVYERFFAVSEEVKKIIPL